MSAEKQMPSDCHDSHAARDPQEEQDQEQGDATIERLLNEESALAERLARLEGTDCRDLASDIWRENRHVINVFGARLKATPRAVAVEYWSEFNATAPVTRLRYCELAWLVERLARQLMDLATFVPRSTCPTRSQNALDTDPKGLRGQQAVLIHAPRDAKVIVAMLAALYCGAVVIVLEEGRADAHVTGIVEEANVFALLHDANKPPPPLPPQCTPLSLPSCAIPLWARFRSTSFKPLPSTDSSIACIIYTSGSSGKPKGAMLRQDSIANYSCIEQAVGNMRPADRVVQLQSLSFVSGYMETFRALLAGGTLVMGGPEISRSGPDLWSWMEAHGITVMKAVPTLCAGMLAGHGPNNPPSVPKCFRLLHLSGERLEQGMVNNLYSAIEASGAQTVILVTYGSTEMSANCSARICKPNDATMSIGPALPSYFVGLLEEAAPSANALPGCIPNTSDASGEIVVGGIGVTVGYLNNEQATCKAFVEVQGHGRLYRTGDKGAWGPNGDIVFLGRVGGSTQVKIAGYRIELGEVEHALLELPYVKAAGALVDSSQKLVVVLESRVSVATQQVRADLKEGGKLPAHGIPSVVHVVDELPHTISGKLDRRRLQAMATELEEVNSTYLTALSTPPEEPEMTLLSGMAIVLGLAKEDDANAWARIPSLGAAHFFNDLGGSSVTAGQLIGWLRQHAQIGYAVHASTRLLFQHPTARDLAAVLKSKSSQEPLRTRQGQDSSESPPPVPKTPSERRAQRMFACFQIVYVLFLVLLDSLDKMAVFRLAGVGQYMYQRIADYGQGRTGIIIALSLFILPVMKKAAGTVIGFMWRFVAIALKWLLIGRYRAGKYPKFGSFHLRHWLVTATLKASAGAAAERSFIGPTASRKELWYRALGIKMGQGVTIDQPESELVRFDLVPDLVTLGSGCVLHMSHLVNVKETATEIELVEVSVGANSVLKPGSVVIGPAVIGDNAELGYNSSLISSDIPDGEVRFGNPARAQTTKAPSKAQAPPWWSWPCISAALLGLIVDYFLTVVFYGVRLSASVVLWSFNPPDSEADRLMRYSIIFAVRSVWYPVVEVAMCALLCRALCLRERCKQASDKAHSIYSALWLRLLIAQRAYRSCLHSLNNTQFVAAFLRWCGASVGSGVSIARTMGTIPQLVTVGKNVFFGNEVYLGMPTLEPGAKFRLQPVEVGDDGLIGNLSVIPPGCSLPPKSVVAVSTVPDCGPAPGGDIEQPKAARPPVCCIGCPPVDLPSGHLQADRPRPTRWQKSRRFVVDVLCAITLPTAESLGFLGALVALLFLHSSTGVAALVDFDATAPFTAEGLLIAGAVLLGSRKLVGAILAVLTLLARCGKLRTGDWDFWSPFVDRWHLNIKLGVAVNQLLLSPFRSAGVDAFTRLFKIVNPFFDCAPDATIAGCRLKEVDVTSIGARSVISHGATLRTHTFEAWRLKIGAVRVGADVVVGENAHILPGAVLEDGCKVLPNTIVANNETVPAGVTFGGSPGEIMMSNPHLVV